MPADVFVSRLPLAVDKNLHALVVQGVRLAEVQHVEAHLAGDDVAGAEEIPLGVSTSIYIILKQQVIIVIVNFRRSCEITGFKTTLKDNRRIVWALLLVKWL